MENSQQNNPISQLPTLQPYILVNDEDKIWLYLKRNSIDRLDIILDNAGFELFCDLCLADYLISLKLAKKIYFHCKNMPWFVSDVTSVDWFWTLKQMQQVDIIVLQQLGIRWENYMNTSQWVLENDMFWTTPFEFIRMAAISPILYSDLQKSQLLLFKGDLNYRKLVGDRKWPSTVPFDDALCGFSPAPLCALRSLKSDLVTGLLSNVAEKLTVTEPNWMISGQYAVIQCNQLLIQSFCTHDEQN